MARRQVSDAAEHTLTAWLDQVAQGQLPLSELPLCVSAFYAAGEADGRASRQPEIDRLNHQLDGLWARAFLTNDQRRERILQRLDKGLREADEATWGRIEQELAELSGQRQQVGTTTIETAKTAGIEGVNGRSSGTTGPAQQAA